MRKTSVVFMIVLFLVSVPLGVRAEELKVPDWVYANCSRYFTMDVNSAGTTITFYRKDDPAKICAVVTNVHPGPARVAEILQALQVPLLTLDCWQIKLGYESIITGLDSNFVLVAECDQGERQTRFIVGYQDGLLIGYVNEW